MILVGLEGCRPCLEMKSRHPELKFVEVPRSAEGNHQALNVKKRLKVLGVNEFPALMNDGMTKVLPLSNIGE